MEDVPFWLYDIRRINAEPQPIGRPGLSANDVTLTRWLWFLLYHHPDLVVEEYFKIHNLKPFTLKHRFELLELPSPLAQRNRDIKRDTYVQQWPSMSKVGAFDRENYTLLDLAFLQIEEIEEAIEIFLTKYSPA